MTDKCKNINIPTVDNSKIECENFVNSVCVKVTKLPTELKVFFGLGENPDLNTVLYKIMNSLIELRSRL